MTDREFQILKDWLEEDEKKEKTREERLRPLVAIGLLDEDGNYTRDGAVLKSYFDEIFSRQDK